MKRQRIFFSAQVKTHSCCCQEHQRQVQSLMPATTHVAPQVHQPAEDCTERKSCFRHQQVQCLPNGCLNWKPCEGQQKDITPCSMSKWQCSNNFNCLLLPAAPLCRKECTNFLWTTEHWQLERLCSCLHQSGFRPVFNLHWTAHKIWQDDQLISPCDVQQTQSVTDRLQFLQNCNDQGNISCALDGHECHCTWHFAPQLACPLLKWTIWQCFQLHGHWVPNCSHVMWLSLLLPTRNNNRNVCCWNEIRHQPPQQKLCQMIIWQEWTSLLVPEAVVNQEHIRVDHTCIHTASNSKVWCWESDSESQPRNMNSDWERNIEHETLLHSDACWCSVEWCTTTTCNTNSGDMSAWASGTKAWSASFPKTSNDHENVSKQWLNLKMCTVLQQRQQSRISSNRNTPGFLVVSPKCCLWLDGHAQCLMGNFCLRGRRPEHVVQKALSKNINVLWGTFCQMTQTWVFSHLPPENVEVSRFVTTQFEVLFPWIVSSLPNTVCIIRKHWFNSNWIDSYHCRDSIPISQECSFTYEIRSLRSTVEVVLVCSAVKFEAGGCCSLLLY